MASRNSYTLYGAPGWGSALVEAMLGLCDATVRLEDVSGFDQPGAARDRLVRINPLAQVPALLLSDGTAMTESAAITLLLAERHPLAGLAPVPGTALRPLFLRRLIWLTANVYPTFTYGDYPERWVSAEPQSLKASTNAFRERLWREFEASVPEGPWALGSELSALDIYVAVMSHWRPRRAWFAEHCPRLHAIAVRADGHEILGPVLQHHFPSTP
jgi:GST-like protein